MKRERTMRVTLTREEYLAAANVAAPWTPGPWIRATLLAEIKQPAPKRDATTPLIDRAKPFVVVVFRVSDDELALLDQCRAAVGDNRTRFIRSVTRAHLAESTRPSQTASAPVVSADAVGAPSSPSAQN
jgi:hypothetical protein